MYQPVANSDFRDDLSSTNLSQPLHARRSSSNYLLSTENRRQLRAAEVSRLRHDEPPAPTSGESTPALELKAPKARKERISACDHDDPGENQTILPRKQYNIFTKSGCEFISRKLRSAGSAGHAGSSSKHRHEPALGSTLRWTGWRMGTMLCCCAVVICIIVEAALLIWAAKMSIGGTESGLLYQGSCAKVKSMALWLLLPLNIAGTVLIGTSNYLMQVMAAPNRSEINEAHRFAQAVAIGGTSFRDLIQWSGGGKPRKAIWWLLGLSSLPIHLLLNSAIYGSVQASNTGVLVVSDDFETDPTWNYCNSTLAEGYLSPYFACRLMQNFRAGQMQELTRDECITQYANSFQTNASSVLVVATKSARKWYNLPASAKVPSSYGIACRLDNENNGGYYIEVLDAERNFQFDFDPRTGTANVSLPFSTDCQYYGISETGVQLFQAPTTNSEATAYTSANALFFTIKSAVSNIDSVLSVFNTMDYRYWATANMTGDYLNENYQKLLTGWDPGAWMCPKNDLASFSQCDPTRFRADSSWDITPASIPVSTCHMLPKEERCALRYSWRVLLVTMCFDTLKLTAMLFALKYISEPLTTLGDVVASFLQEPDPYTKGNCLLGEKEAGEWTFAAWKEAISTVQGYFASQGRDWHESCGYLMPEDTNCNMRGSGQDLMASSNQPPTKFEREANDWLSEGGQWWPSAVRAYGAAIWAVRRRRWLAAPSRLRWLSFTLLYVVTPRNCHQHANSNRYLSLVASSIVFLASGIRALRRDRLTSVWSVGFSGPSPDALYTGGLLSGARNISWAAMLINLPQVLFSMLYFMFNSLLTMMHSAHEWSSFAKHRKALRVSSPVGQQRSTYWLQLPWSYSLPTIIASGTLHWLLGRSVYLVKVDVYGYFGAPQSDRDFFACGYSPITVLLLLVLLAAMGVALAAVALQRLESGAPLVRLNSLAIAAACHADPAEKDIAFLPLMWGVLKDESGADSTHCSFSAKEVSPLQEGVAYA
jgi:hypothetical protein